MKYSNKVNVSGEFYEFEVDLTLNDPGNGNYGCYGLSADEGVEEGQIVVRTQIRIHRSQFDPIVLKVDIPEVLESGRIVSGEIDMVEIPVLVKKKAEKGVEEEFESVELSGPSGIFGLIRRYLGRKEK